MTLWGSILNYLQQLFLIYCDSMSLIVGLDSKKQKTESQCYQLDLDVKEETLEVEGEVEAPNR